jgi:hypothetical protein
MFPPLTKRWLIEDGDEDDDGKVRERAPFN